MADDFQIRHMMASDLAFAASCTQEEGWGTASLVDFEGLFAHDVGGCLVAVAADGPAGICTAMPYGPAGFIGMLIVRRQHRGRGMGRALLEHAIAYLRNRGATCVLLDGVTLAVPLYERVGFRRVCRSLRFRGTVVGKAHRSVRPMGEDDLSVVSALDRVHFGVDRSFFLARRLALYPQVCRVHRDGARVTGFILGRLGESFTAIGPWLATAGPDSARALLESLAPEGESMTIAAGLLATSPAAAALMRSLGMKEREDPPWRMALGPGPLIGVSPDLYAVGSPAKG